KDWNENGMLFNDFNYINGYEEGLQRAWYPDGSLQANYVVKNNRKYGLTGVKNCITANENNK
ncbi:MAG TPA: toxin-antitoxin system YwqK family antitoxin, partial [Ignavibacteria bacterium]|nr:toxin-antitoxin system YwqK family antitoxin [Ignavibacteria bacterium]